jgi:hypothetical protein
MQQIYCIVSLPISSDTEFLIQFSISKFLVIEEANFYNDEMKITDSCFSLTVGCDI